MKFYVFTLIILLFSSWIYATIISIFVFFAKIINSKKISRTTKKNIDGITYIVPVYNGANSIQSKIENILENTENIFKYQILIILDGCKDNTSEILKEFILSNPKLNIDKIEYSQNKGRSFALNKGIQNAKYSTLIFSDIDTKFTKSFPNLAIKKFASSLEIGCVVGKLKYKKENLYSLFQYYYFNCEVFFRSLLSFASIGSLGSGACMVVDKKICQELQDFEDIDNAIGFFCIVKNLKIIQSNDSLVEDNAYSDASSEFKARRRQVRKLLLSITHRIRVDKKSFRYYLYTFGVLLNKPIRYLVFPLSVFFIIFSIYLTLKTLLLIIFPNNFLTSTIGLAMTLLICKFPILNSMLSSSFGIINGIVQFFAGNKSGKY